MFQHFPSHTNCVFNSPEISYRSYVHSRAARKEVCATD
ncbi:unnamed protein product [Gulo gulo]|uniref:Uncharacterized protein n=1 Tax=Gulo gulo TaxID=48420 RepID=A0A9X9LQ41_GULGU|nr:unnamed protein product [Gulo gulo]